MRGRISARPMVRASASQVKMTAGSTWVASWPWCRRIPGWSSPLPPCPGLILTQPGGCRCSPVPDRLGRRRWGTRQRHRCVRQAGAQYRRRYRPTCRAGRSRRPRPASAGGVLTRRGQLPAPLLPARSGNGRALDDNAFDIAVATLAGSTLGNASVPRPPATEFSYLSAPRPAELPVLAGTGHTCPTPGGPRQRPL
jgi:hypothetical protein